MLASNSMLTLRESDEDIHGSIDLAGREDRGVRRWRSER